MSKFSDLPKAYDASSVEDGINAAWEASGVFNPDKLPDRNQKGEPYCIVMPPPNRTGTLHMGHATMLAIEDLLIRFHRMRGKKTFWIPGTDHAAIATQVKVEQLLIKGGIKDPRKELGREKFLEEVVKFAEQSAATIRTQVRKMGSSCDWSREKYTLDEERNRAVNKVFEMMCEDGIIERGYRVVNWDPQFQTTLSDDEVVYKETTARLLTFKYDQNFPFYISTTRPETKFGDTAVAVHPDDPRYKKYIDQVLNPIFCGVQLHIKIIPDESVDPNFGTGALGVTPAHSRVDAEIAERHGLATVPVIGKDAKIIYPLAVGYLGLTTIEARKKIEDTLQALGLLKDVQEVPQNLPIAERGGTPVEELPMRQWFIRVNKPFTLRQDTLGVWKKGDKTTLKDLMRKAVESNQTRIVPEQFTKIYYHWIDNLRDWCISRQIWFGHQIPVWYKQGGANENISAHHDDSTVWGDWVASDASPGEGWERDPDTLDTWFSSGLWTFSTLGWPDADAWAANKAYHPTAVLETGYDILFFWVARMVLMSTYVLGEVPFKDVYLHGLIRDEQGRKMSKSLGNVIDPLDVIPKYGTDAVRLSLVMGTTPGQDTKLAEAKIEGLRNFTNKLWNISRFILMTIGDSPAMDMTLKTLADRWILSRLAEVTSSVTKKIETYQFSAAGEELRDFTWGDLADWYLEIAKVEKGKEAILRHILKSILALWHPFMPFVTEHVWKIMGADGQLIVAPWPEAAGFAPAPEFEVLGTLVTDMRRLRAEQGIEPVKQVEFAIVASADVKTLVQENIEVVQHLARASSISFVDAVDSGWATIMSGSVTIGLNTAGAVDVAKEREKAQKEIEMTAKYVDGLNKQLANTEFMSRAPAFVVDGLKQKLAEAEAKLKTLEEKLKGLR